MSVTYPYSVTIENVKQQEYHHRCYYKPNEHISIAQVPLTLIKYAKEFATICMLLLMLVLAIL